MSVLALAGCASGGAQPASLNTSNAAANLTPLATPTASDAPVDPPLADEPAAKVESVVRAYVTAVNTALSSGATADLRALTDPTCTCTRLIDTLEADADAGVTYRGADWSLGQVTVRLGLPNGEADARVQSAFAPYERVGPEGVVIEVIPAVNANDTFLISADGLVLDVDSS